MKFGHHNKHVYLSCRQVLDQLTFYPQPEEIYANNGCKLLSEKAAMLIQREVLRMRKS